MIAFDRRPVNDVIGSIGIVAVYGFSLWRIVRNNPKNKGVECGGITIIVFIAMAALANSTNSPDWIIVALIILVVPLCLLTLFFFTQRAFRAIRHRNIDPHNLREVQDRNG